jgi:hypothetical protein
MLFLWCSVAALDARLVIAHAMTLDPAHSGAHRARATLIVTISAFSFSAGVIRQSPIRRRRSDNHPA